VSDVHQQTYWKFPTNTQSGVRQQNLRNFYNLYFSLGQRADDEEACSIGVVPGQRTRDDVTGQ